MTHQPLFTPSNAGELMSPSRCSEQAIPPWKTLSWNLSPGEYHETIMAAYGKAAESAL